jgi:hypothetical protein
MRALLAALILCATASMAHAQSESDISACKTDAINICNASIADLWNYDRVAKCMKEKKAQLSPRCRRVLDAHGL